ncbi:MAG: ParB N-terminal domain-containing protein [Dehalococcoidia bacterium]
MKIVKVPIGQLDLWDKNPRGISKADFARLKKQITKLGVYKPLVAYLAKGRYVVLGGNMRLRALKDMGVKEVEVSIVEAKTEARRIEIALSDNDRAGFYEEDKLAELVYPEISNLDLETFKVDLGEAVDLKRVIEGVSSTGSGGDQEQVDKLAKNESVICPKCGHEFIP